MIKELGHVGAMMIIAVLLLLGSMIILLWESHYLRLLITETAKMASTDNIYLKQCKLKYTNCCLLHHGMSNVMVFVERFLNQTKFYGMTIRGYQYLSGELIMASVFASGIGVYFKIIRTGSMFEVLPYYFVSMISLFLYFSVATLTDIEKKREILQADIVNYLENQMNERVHVLREAEKSVSFEEKNSVGDDFLKNKGNWEENPDLEAILEKMLESI